MTEFNYTTNVTGEIVHIPISLLFHHPDNPRKDLGDLTELADSIRAKGVMQNLTVVPFRDQADIGGYYVVIGNRRMEASKQAGLKTLPCIISNMTYKDQLATMLLENMQRVDLTPLEQAQGFQLMIDFGETVDGISDKTGFSKTTVRRRLEIAKLDKKLLADAADRQITIGDLDKLTELDDVEERNEVLKFIGTPNFSWHLSQAKQRQTQREREDEWRKALTGFGLTELPSKEGWDRKDLKGVAQFRLDLKKAEEFTPDAYRFNFDDCYFFFDYGWVYLEGPRPEEEEEKPKVDPIAEEMKQRCARLEELNDRAYDLREAFIKSLTEAQAKKGFTFAISAVACRDSYMHYNERICDLFDIDDEDKPALAEAVRKEPYRAAAFMGFVARWGDTNLTTYTSWGTYDENKILNTLYNYLAHFGYEISDEEQALIDGTHEAYFREDEE